MALLNLSLPELLAIFSVVSGLVVTLYLLDRVRRRYTVSSLRFFTAGGQSQSVRHRRRIQQPWSLLLQLIAMALLLLAIADVRFGPDPRSARSHILVLDTSAWMGAASPLSTPSRPRSLMEDARAAARKWLATLPARDPVMLVRADGVPGPATPFETSREAIVRAIDASRPGAAVLGIDRALQFAEQIRTRASLHGAEIVFAGAGRTLADDLPAADNVQSLRLLRVASPAEHCGLRRVGVRRSPTDADVWQILISAHNYGAAPKNVSVAATFAGAPAGIDRFVLAAHAERSAEFALRTRTAGPLEVRLTPDDVFRADHQTTLELPAREFADVAVYSDQPDLLRPVFASIRGVRAAMLPVSAWTGGASNGIVVLDRFAPRTPPAGPSIWIDPPAAESPIAVAAMSARTRLRRWRTDNEVSAGIATRDTELAGALIFRPRAGDVAIAEAEAGPVIVARNGPPRQVVLGFQPLLSEMRYELATPLLFANAVRWLAPRAFRRQELSAASAGVFQTDLDENVDPASITVSASGGAKVPWTLDGRELRLFTAEPGVVHVATADRDLAFSLTLPDPGDVIWSPRNAVYGLPATGLPVHAPREIWQWLAVLGGAGLLAEWLLYARDRAASAAVRRQATPADAWKRAS